MIPVLFGRVDSIYKQLGCDVWDIERDARRWPGGQPGIYHPPCRSWGKLKGFAKPRPGEKQLAVWSINRIRLYGGVLEHPRHSGLWKHMNLPKGNEVDRFGGYSISVDQYWWGHKAQKESLLYIVGCEKTDLPDIPLNFNRREYYVGFPKSFKGKSRYGYQEISRKEREETPELFAKWLIQVVENCNKSKTK